MEERSDRSEQPCALPPTPYAASYLLMLAVGRFAQLFLKSVRVRLSILVQPGRCTAQLALDNAAAAPARTFTDISASPILP